MSGFPITSGGATVLGLVQSGGAFNTSILGNITSTTSGLTSAAGLLTSTAGLATNGMNFSGFSGLDSSLSTITASGGALDSLTSHVQSQFTNLTNNAGLYIGQLNVQQGLNKIGSSLSSLSSIDTSANLCAGLSNAFGTITGVAGGLLQTIGGAVEEITSTIEGLLALGAELVQDAINAAVQAVAGLISTIEGAAASILSQIANEVAFIANALGDLINYGIQSALTALFGNQCGQELLNAVGSSALLSALAVA